MDRTAQRGHARIDSRKDQVPVQSTRTIVRYSVWYSSFIVEAFGTTIWRSLFSMM